MAWMDYLREIPDFPEPGVLFRDVLPVLAVPDAWREVLDSLEQQVRPLGAHVVMAPEARGFLLAAPLADRLGAGLVPVRKPGKLPDPVFRERYTLEYGENQLEVEETTVLKGRRVVIVDDVLATGGTVKACAHLAERLGAEIAGFAFLIELKALNGRSRLDDIEAPVLALERL
ncbi:adenine phosphoribosyltransferase [Sulfobacillus harzensis]|uniref:Adenine phosphoribosyltransferase n=1 Tax=Sulfobacillus harzensis TaxID=2729629 RepID=A0A7Y0L3Z5_9FIRM|nr:adenine phosphoribosyltransferase [Sulfobacillus harzensis]NMP22507.1 adenine phosphoribosyltransferase [Sulfobacillus harzensis]